tara:strand:- start:185 stop:1201 length:1017 start_codon:yes stop_codon:yes gene_type:complete
MICSQRGSSFASITNAYCLDRFKFRNSNGISGTFTVSQSTDTPDGFGNSLKVDVGTADAAMAAGEVFNIGTLLEGQDLQRLAKGTSGAKKSVLSFYVKTNKTGQYSVLLYDNDNGRMFSTSYTVSNTNWNRYTIDVAADTTGAYGNDNASSLEIYWYLGAGSNRTSGTLTNAWASYVAANVAAGQVNFADSTSNEFYITGIQYEVNESGVATDFEHLSYGDTLAKCQRYYYRAHDSSNSGQRPIELGVYENANTMTTTLRFPDMRSSPTIDVTDASNAFMIRRQDGSDDFDTFTLRYSTVNSAEIVSPGSQASGNSGIGGMVRSNASTTVYLAFSAEL